MTVRALSILSCLVLIGCASQYRIQGGRDGMAMGEISFAKGRSQFLQNQNLIRWSYFWDPPKVGQLIRLPQDLGSSGENSLTGLKIQSYFTANDALLAILPFVERRHFNIIYHRAGQEDSTKEGEQQLLKR